MFCVKCGSVFKNGLLFCPACGQMYKYTSDEIPKPIPMDLLWGEKTQPGQSDAATEDFSGFCPHCGSRQFGKTVYCYACGSKIPDSVATLDGALENLVPSADNPPEPSAMCYAPHSTDSHIDHLNTKKKSKLRRWPDRKTGKGND